MAKLTEKQANILRQMQAGETLTETRTLYGYKSYWINNKATDGRSVMALLNRRFILRLPRTGSAFKDEYTLTETGRAAIMTDASAAAQPATADAEAWTPSGHVVIGYTETPEGKSVAVYADDEPAPTASADAVTDETVTFAEYQDRRREIYELTHERDYLQREYDAISQAFDGYMKANAEREDREETLTHDRRSRAEYRAALRKLVSEIQEVAEDALGDWIAVQSDYAPDETVTFAEYQDKRREIYELTHERDYLQREYDAISQAFDGYMKANAEREDREETLTRDLEAARTEAAALRKLVSEIQEVAEDALGDWIAVQSDYAPDGMGNWYTVRDLISEFATEAPYAALVAARQRADDGTRFEVEDIDALFSGKEA